MDAPIDSANNATTSATAQYLHAPDPLALELCLSVGHHEWVSPMLEEFTASLVVSLLAGALALGSLVENKLSAQHISLG